jgi:tripartite-type tricarboxylate transporter receptor subunit TctC
MATTAGTPKTVVDRLVDAVQTALADRSVRQRLDGLGMVIFPRDQQNPEALVTVRRRVLPCYHTGVRLYDT